MSKTKKTLQAMFPGLAWTTVRNGFGWAWESSSGCRASWKSQLVSTSPNDSDGHAQSVLVLQIPGKPDEIISWGKIYAL